MNFSKRYAEELEREVERLRKTDAWDEVARQGIEIAQLEDEVEGLRGDLEKQTDRADGLEALCRIGREKNERLRAENEGLRGNLKGNPVLATFDGIEKLKAEVERLRADAMERARLLRLAEDECERLRSE